MDSSMSIVSGDGDSDSDREKVVDEPGGNLPLVAQASSMLNERQRNTELSTNFSQKTANVKNAYEIAGGEFQGASFGPQNYHLTRKEGVFGGDFSRAHIGPKTVHSRVKHTYIINNYGQGTSSDHAEPSTSERLKPEEQDTIQLSESIRMFKKKPLCRQGNVYEGDQRSEIYGTRPLAVKFLPHNERNALEAKTLLRLSHHPNVVSIINTDVYRGGPFPNIYIAMELCHSQNLHDFVEQSRAESFDSDARMVQGKQLVSGMSFIHENHIIHRDLKPHNVLLSLDKRTLKIADFGLSKEIVSGRSVTAQSILRVGTDGYRAPETYNSDVISQQADVFSLGLVLYYLWSDGCHAFGDDPDDWNSNIKRNRNRDLSRLLIRDPEKATQLLQMTLEFEPRNRPTADEILNELILISIVEKQGRKRTRESDSDEAGTSKRDIQRFDSIAVFDRKSESLLFYKPARKIWETKQKLNEDMMKKKLFTAVAHSGFIYVLMSSKTVYRLDYSQPDAAWRRVSDMLDDHGWNPPALIINDAIYVVGSNGGFGDAATTVESYNFKSDSWKRLRDMKTTKRNHAVAAVNDAIYCIGGWDDRYNVLATVESLNLDTGVWRNVPPLNRGMRSAAALTYSGDIYVMGGHDGQSSLRSVERYHAKTNQWTTVTEMRNSRCQFRALIVNGDIFVVGGDEGRTIETLDIQENQWRMVDVMQNMKIFRMASVGVDSSRREGETHTTKKKLR